MEAATGNRSVSSSDVLARPRETLAVPFIPLDQLESLVTGFRMSVIDCEAGGVASHGGCGSPFAVTLSWKGRHATITGQDLLAAWVGTFSPEDAAKIKAATVNMAPEDPPEPRPLDEEDEDDRI